MSVSDGVTPDEGEWPFAKIGSTLRIRCPTRAELDAEAAVRDAKVTPEESGRTSMRDLTEQAYRFIGAAPPEWEGVDGGAVASADVTQDALLQQAKQSFENCLRIAAMNAVPTSISFAQDATSSHTITSWPSNMSFAGGKASDELREADSMRYQRDAALAELNEAIDENGRLALDWTRATLENITLRTELARAHDLLAQRPAPVPDTPKPAVVIREHRHDPRRMGR